MLCCEIKVHFVFLLSLAIPGGSGVCICLYFSELDEYLCRAHFRWRGNDKPPHYFHLLSIPSSSAAAIHKSRSCLGNGAVSQMHFSSVSYLVATAASICVHVQEEMFSWTGSLPFYCGVCVMLPYGLSLQSCRIWQIFYKAYWAKYECRSVYVYILKTNKQLQKSPWMS